jgi:hypothetical protein
MRIKSIKLQINLKRLIYLTIAWVFAGLFFTIIEFLLVNPASKIPDIKFLTPDVHISSYDFWRSVSTTMLGAVIAGLSIGAFEIFYFHNRFRKKPFGYTVFIKSLVYSFAMVLLIITGLFFDQSFSSGKSFCRNEEDDPYEIIKRSSTNLSLNGRGIHNQNLLSVQIIDN